MHQVIFNIIVTNDLVNKVFEYTDPWDETLVYTVWEQVLLITALLRPHQANIYV